MISVGVSFSRHGV